ncbi:MAG TPA: Gfo/Idh/MocA family oxidoreductase [Acidimicrobiales bacterium]|nr:Gfo/Idh/MocA family oxidoreductase [Acidimicrobiales bacterium]
MIRSAVIGTGAISAEHLSFLERYERAEVVATCDLSEASAGYAAARFRSAGPFTDYREMLDKVAPDVVHVLTPPQTHVQIGMDCLAAGAHVISEKPIALCVADFERLWANARSVDRFVVEDQNYRFNRPVVQLRQLMDTGILGEVQDVELRLNLDIRNDGALADPNYPSSVHRLPAGAVHDFLPHMTYLLLHLAPMTQFDRVIAAWRNHGGGTLFRYDDLDAVLLSDSVHARLRFTAYEYPGSFRVTVRGTRGFVETDLLQPYLRVEVPRGPGRKLAPIVNHFVNGAAFVRAGASLLRDRVLQRSVYEGLHHFLSLTYQALADGHEPPIGFADMRSSIRLIDALLDEENRV